MQLDKTRVAIRERSLVDILDLALRVIRAHPVGVLAAFLVGVAPWFVLLDAMAFDRAVGAWQTYQAERGFPQGGDEVLMGYLVCLGLVVLVSPLAMAPLTLYISRVAFIAKPRTRELGRAWLKALPQLLVFQVLIRGILAACCGVGLLVSYWFMPYINEIILLEGGNLTQTYRRNGQLNRELSSVMIGRWFGALVAGSLLMLALWIGIVALGNLMFLTDPDPIEATGWRLRYVIPASLWLTLGYCTVVRYLAYLDSRIRCEGWEIELKMRAEAQHLANRFS